MIEFRGPAKRIEDIDLPRIGAMIGVGEDEIHAIIDVEAAGGGFDSMGRPKALYEPHVAYRNSAGATRNALVKAGLAYPTWGEKPYPVDSYPRIIAACQLNETVALKATSWGLGQILGENHVAAGYATVQDMVRDFTVDEDRHLAAMVRFIKAKNLDDEVRAHNWAAFARGYNGPQYAKNAYDKKLAAAFAKWSKIKDTPWALDAPQKPLQPPTSPNATVPAKPTSPAPAAAPVPSTPAAPKGFWRRFLGALFRRTA